MCDRPAATLNLIAWFGACTKSCLVPTYSSRSESTRGPVATGLFTLAVGVGAQLRAATHPNHEERFQLVMHLPHRAGEVAN